MPLADLSPDSDFFALLTESYMRLVGAALPHPHLGPAWLYGHAPYARAGTRYRRRPRFIYANKTAQRCFEHSWDEIISTPSRLSTEAPNQAERG